MAKIKDEIMRLSIVVNGDPARKELIDLEKAQRNLAQETDKLKVKRNEIRKSLGKESQEYKELFKQIKDNEAI